MRIRRASPFLLLAASSLGHALELSNLRKRSPEGLQARDKEFVQTEPAASAPPRESLRAGWRTTEDAPVDGLDGKPHAGPFVDAARDDSTKAKDAPDAPKEKPKPADLDKWTQAGSGEWRLEEVPERNDGVMNDDTRVGPKKGTDGTAGGISEKEKERRRKGYEGNKPQEPKTAPELPHSEQEWIQKEKEEGSKTKTGEASTESAGTDTTSAKKEGKEFGVGGYGMQKPENLPEKPHNIPHPDPGTGKTATQESNAGSNRDSWLQDTMPYTEGPNAPQTAQIRRLCARLLRRRKLARMVPLLRPLLHHDPLLRNRRQNLPRRRTDGHAPRPHPRLQRSIRRSDRHDRPLRGPGPRIPDNTPETTHHIRSGGALPRLRR